MVSKNSFDGADYSYISFRKWTGFSGIALVSINLVQFDELPVDKNNKYCEMRRNAAELKRAYLEDGVGEKQNFFPSLVRQKN